MPTRLRRFHHFNVHNHETFQDKLRYIHRNSVRKQLCSRAEDWPWSSFRHYATGQEGIVEIESDWTANKRERAAGRLCALSYNPTQAKEA
jgi:putative transposase